MGVNAVDIYRAAKLRGNIHHFYRRWGEYCFSIYHTETQKILYISQYTEKF